MTLYNVEDQVVPRCLDIICDLGITNLIVSGCSFTHTYHREKVLSWPWYLRDYANIKNCFDLSCPGAGNAHVKNSLIWFLEQNDFDPSNTLVIAQWTTHDRDDFIADPNSLDRSRESWAYSPNAALALSGGIVGETNCILNLDNVKKIKSYEARAIENYLNVMELYHYLQDCQFKWAFTEISTPGAYSDGNFEIRDFLPSKVVAKFDSVVKTIQPNLGDFGLPYLHTSFDKYHPMPEVHRLWTQDVLIPWLKTYLAQ